MVERPRVFGGNLWPYWLVDMVDPVDPWTSPHTVNYFVMGEAATSNRVQEIPTTPRTEAEMQAQIAMLTD